MWLRALSIRFQRELIAAFLRVLCLPDDAGYADIVPYGHIRRIHFNEMDVACK